MIVAEAGLPNHILVMVQQGATSPISYAGSVAVHNADFLAFNTLLQCVNKGNPTLYGASACVMDMKKGLSLVAAPEVFVLNAGDGPDVEVLQHPELHCRWIDGQHMQRRAGRSRTRSQPPDDRAGRCQCSFRSGYA